MSSKEEAANQAVQDAKSMIRDGKYKDAKAKIQGAINLFPTIKYGREFITLCEILHLSNQTPKNHRRREIWPYTLFQIPSSSSEFQVYSRHLRLRLDLATIEFLDRIKGTAAAIKELESAMSMYKENFDRKRKAPSPSPDHEDENKATGDENTASDEDGVYGYKKLRDQIFTALPQQPHCIPLAKYCARVRQEMKLGCDKIFVKLTQKLQNFGGDDQILSDEEEDMITGELSDLEEMGYDVMKLRERFDLLARVKTIVEEDEKYEAKRNDLDGKIGAEKVKLEKVQGRISELKSEKLVMDARHDCFKSEMASLKFKLSKGDLYNMVKNGGN